MGYNEQLYVTTTEANHGYRKTQRIRYPLRQFSW